MTSLTFFTASSTPLPPKRFWSPSRSSTASCSPVEAPLGTAARPVAPLASVTSVSSVGLPRLSRISRAWTEMTVLIVARTLLADRRRVNARPQRKHRVPGAVAQRLAVVERQMGRRNRLSHPQADRLGAEAHAPFGLDLEGVVHVHRDERHARRDREPEGRVLERQQLARAAARPLGEDDRGDTALDGARRLVVRLEGALAVRAVDGDMPGGAHRPAEQRDAEQLLLGDEPHRARQRGEQGPDVEHGRVVRRVQHRLVARNALQSLRVHRRARGAEDLPRPVRPGPVVHAAGMVPHAEQSRPDRGDGVVHRRSAEHGVEPDGSDHDAVAKWSYPAGSATGVLPSSSRTPPPRKHTPMRVSASPSSARNAATSASANAAGSVTSSSNSSPLAAAASGATPSQHGRRSSAISSPTPDAAARWPASAARPSLTSSIAVAPRAASQRPAAIRGSGRTYRRPSAPPGRVPVLKPASASPAPPSRPVTHRPSPSRAPARRTGRCTLPSTHTSTTYFSERTRSPPSTLAPTLCTAAPTPAMISTAGSTFPVARFSFPGIPSETSTPIGSAPSAARSESAAAAARQPISSKVSQSVRK